MKLESHPWRDVKRGISISQGCVKSVLINGLEGKKTTKGHNTPARFAELNHSHHTHQINHGSDNEDAISKQALKGRHIKAMGVAHRLEGLCCGLKKNRNQS